ncbi:MAG: hypothetical protein Q4E00_01635 [Actinomyces bowdenii]|nr:hypothetical protein [Actinomyces bowdenii]
MGFAVLLLIIVALIGLWSIFDPRGMWRATESWKFRNPEANEPSEASFALSRITGVISVIGVLIFIGVLLQGPPGSQESQRDSRTRSASSYDPFAQPTDDGLEPYPVSPDPIDAFSSAAQSPAALGDPVTIFTPVLQSDSSGSEGASSSATTVGLDPVYYPWTSGDHPAAFAAATVIDSKTALGTLDMTQASTPDAGESTLGEATYIIVRLSRPVCAISSISATTSNERIRISVRGVSDETRCGQTVNGAYVAVPLSEDQVAMAQSYEAPSYRPIATAGTRRMYSSPRGEFVPTVFVSQQRTGLDYVWMDEQTDKQVAPGVLVPWLPSTDESLPSAGPS